MFRQSGLVGEVQAVLLGVHTVRFVTQVLTVRFGVCAVAFGKRSLGVKAVIFWHPGLGVRFR